MTDVPAATFHDGLPSALFDAYVAAFNERREMQPDPQPWEEQPDPTKAMFRSMAHRLTAEGVLTLLEIPEGHEPEQAELHAATVGDPVVKLGRAIRVAAISTGFLRGADGNLAVAGQFVGDTKDEPGTDVAVAFLLSLHAAAGFVRQIIQDAASLDSSLAAEIAGVAVQTLDEVAAKTGGIVMPVMRPRYGNGG